MAGRKSKLKLRNGWRSQYAKPVTTDPPDPDPDPLVNTVPTSVTLAKGQPFAVPLTSTGAFGAAYWTVGNIARFSEDDVNLLWSAAGEPTNPGDYVCVVTVSDELQRSAAVTVTVTLTAAPVALNGPVQNLSVVPVNETQGLMSFDPPLTGDPPTHYLYRVDDHNQVMVPVNRLLTALSPNTSYLVTVWPVNAAGIGEQAVATLRTPGVPNQTIEGEYIQFKLVDETDQSTYNLPASAVNAGAAGQEYEMVVETQGGSAHIHKSVSLGGTAGVQALTTQPGQHMISHWRVPWGAGKTTPAVPVVTLRNDTDTAAFTALRCIVYLRPLLNRPAALVASGVVTSNPATATLSNTPANALASIASGAQLAGVDMLADMTNIAPDPVGETFQTALNSTAGHVSPADDEPSRDISITWRDPAGGTPLQPRMTYVVYDEPTIVVQPGNVTPQWADDVVEGFAVATHFDLGRSDPISAGHPWTYGRITNNVQLIGELGARKWRSKSYRVTDASPQMRQYTYALYSGYGMRGFGPITNDNDDNSGATRTSIVNRMNATVAELNAGGVRRWIAFEGNNESNSPETRLPNWNVITQAHQRLIYERTMQLDNQLDVIAASIWGRNDAARELLGSTADGIDPWCTVGCIHLYNGGRNTNLCGQGLGQDETGSGDMFVWEGIRDAKTLSPSKTKMWGTEMGMQLANEQGCKGWTMPDAWVQALGNNSLDGYGAMTYDLRYMFECYIRGAPYGFNTYTNYVSQDDIQSRPNKCFGLMYPNQAKTLNIPRPRYYSFKRTMNMFKDRGSWSGTAWQFNTPPLLTPITPRVTGGNALTFPIVPGQTQRGKWYKKRNGQLLGIFWQNEVMFKRDSNDTPVNFHRPFENPTYDPTTVKTPDNTLTPARRTITVEPNVGQTFSKIEVFEPTFDNNRPAYGQDGLYGSDGTATAAKTVNNASSVAVQVGGHLVVVVATP